MELSFLTISEALALFSRREISAADLTEACLRQIERLNPVLNAFITVAGVISRSEATKQSPNLQKDLPLFGIPIALKDLYETAGIRTTAGS